MRHSIRLQQFEVELCRRVPEEFRDGFREYYRHGARPKGLVAAIVNGSLFDAYSRAGIEQRELIPVMVAFVVDNMTVGSYGNPVNVSTWVARGGFLGRRREAA